MHKNLSITNILQYQYFLNHVNNILQFCIMFDKTKERLTCSVSTSCLYLLHRASKMCSARVFEKYFPVHFVSYTSSAYTSVLDGNSIFASPTDSHLPLTYRYTFLLPKPR